MKELKVRVAEIRWEDGVVAVESGEGIESIEHYCLPKRNRPQVESGEGIERPPKCWHFRVSPFPVESGEGIESLFSNGNTVLP